MTTMQLRAELLREMNPLLDNDVAMKKMLAFVKTLAPAKKANTETERQIVLKWNYERLSA